MQLHAADMGTMNISLPDSLKSFVEEQRSARGYGTSSEYVRELIRTERDREHLRILLLEGAASEPTVTQTVASSTSCEMASSSAPRGDRQSGHPPERANRDVEEAVDHNFAHRVRPMNTKDTTTTVKHQKKLVSQRLTWIRRDLEKGKPVAEEDWRILGTEYHREADACRKAGVPEERLRANRQRLIAEFHGISDAAGQRISQVTDCG